MIQRIKEMFSMLGISMTYQSIDGVVIVYIHKAYIHYDELEPFTKLGCFKGVGVDIKGNITLQFID